MRPRPCPTTCRATSRRSCGSPFTDRSGRPDEPASQLPVNPRTQRGPSARRAGARFLSDLRGGRAFLAAELSQSGWLDFGAFRWRDLALSQSVRATIGVLTPLIIGVATGKIEYGSYAALGALPAGFVSFRGVSRTRVLAVLFAAAGMAVSTFVGATTAASRPWLLVPAVFAWAYVIGVLAALGPTVLAVTLQWPVALLIASALPLGPGQAFARAGLVLAGGLWQALLVATSWAVNRGNAERTALATTYADLAGYAADVVAGRQTPPSPVQLTASYVLRDPNPLMRTAPREHMLDLAEEAERIRATLTALSIGRSGAAPGPGPRRILDAAAHGLTELAAAIGGHPGVRAEHLSAARSALEGVSADTGSAWQWAAESLLSQLRSACRIAERLNAAEPRSGHVGRGSPQPIRASWRPDAMLTVRASLGTSSEAGRHALRLAVLAALAEVIAQASGLSHGYWIVLTIFIVLRPDYSSTLYRGLQRAAGTVVGAGLGVATVLLLKVSLTALLCVIGVSLVAAYAVFTVNYLLYAVFLTDFLVVMLALLGLPPDPTAVARLIGTGIGTGLAILAYLLWPTWEGTSAAEKFARLITAQGSYGRALLRSYTRPGGTESAQLGSLQLAARRARIDAEASADRLAGEPEHPPMSARTARALISAGHRIARALITLGAAVTAHHASKAAAGDAAVQPDLDELATGVVEATDRIAAALRAGQPATAHLLKPPGRLPPLRAEQQAIWQPRADGAADAAGPRQPGQPESEAAGLFAATDSLVDAIYAAAHALGE
ncbi:MAG TPA: FUSC family protein [Streptosporangiaceae bacterium]|nr:FUSC family protein [Streptosporangiaceae bacterium]